MEFTASRAQFDACLRSVSDDLSTREDALARHAHLGLSGDHLTIVCRDRVTVASIRLDVHGKADGEIGTDQRRLGEFLHRATAEDVRARVTGSNLHLRSGAATIELPVAGANLEIPGKYPRNGVRVSSEQLSRVVRRVLPCAHTDSTHPLWTVHLVLSASSISAEATDGRAFARAAEPGTYEPLEAAMNRRMAASIVGVSTASETVILRNGENHVRADVGDVTVVGLKQHAAFPGAQNLFTAPPTATMEVGASELAFAVEMMRIVEDDAGVALRINSSGLRLNVHGSEAAAAVPIRAALHGSPTSRIVSLSNLRAACLAMDVERFTIAMVDQPNQAVRLADQFGLVSWLLASRTA